MCAPPLLCKVRENMLKAFMFYSVVFAAAATVVSFGGFDHGTRVSIW